MLFALDNNINLKFYPILFQATDRDYRDSGERLAVSVVHFRPQKHKVCNICVVLI